VRLLNRAVTTTIPDAVSAEAAGAEKPSVRALKQTAVKRFEERMV
jgi:hypothetical protein